MIIGLGFMKQLEDEADYHIIQVNVDRLHNKIIGQMELNEESVLHGAS